LSITPTIDPTGLEVLADLGAVAPEVIAEQAVIAEYALGLNGVTLVGDALTVARLAVALQIKFQLQTGVDAKLYISKSRGARSWTFNQQAQVGVDTTAAQLAKRLTTDNVETYPIVRSL
jgi:hypothetical protein